MTRTVNLDTWRQKAVIRIHKPAKDPKFCARNNSKIPEPKIDRALKLIERMSKQATKILRRREAEASVILYGGNRWSLRVNLEKSPRFDHRQDWHIHASNQPDPCFHINSRSPKLPSKRSSTGSKFMTRAGKAGSMRRPCYGICWPSGTGYAALGNQRISLNPLLRLRTFSIVCTADAICCRSAVFSLIINIPWIWHLNRLLCSSMLQTSHPG